jgi:hypothetical protein
VFHPHTRLLIGIPVRIDDEPFTSLNENLNELAILDEEDDRAPEAPDENQLIESISTVFEVSSLIVKDTIPDDESTQLGTSSYLLEDDIEEI